jgi:hypothetical protein
VFQTLSAGKRGHPAIVGPDCPTAGPAIKLQSGIVTVKRITKHLTKGDRFVFILFPPDVLLSFMQVQYQGEMTGWYLADQDNRFKIRGLLH